METLEVSALEEPTLAVAEGLSMTSLFEHSVAEPTETSCLMNGDLSKLAQKSPKFYFQNQFSVPKISLIQGHYIEVAQGAIFMEQIWADFGQVGNTEKKKLGPIMNF